MLLDTTGPSTLDALRGAPARAEFTVAIADLVMCQVLGNLGALESLLQAAIQAESDNPGSLQSSLDAYLSEVGKRATSPRFFREVARKTIRAQVGDPLATIRELVQNAIDAYAPTDWFRRVDIRAACTHALGTLDRLEVEDAGRGMDLATVLGDLLIPYNSTKSDDPDTIGEHGIGWFTIVDVSRQVTVITYRATCSPLRITITSHASPDDSTGQSWSARVEILDSPPNLATGTLVVADLAPTGMTDLDLRSHAFHYLGLVPGRRAQIRLNGEEINTLDRSYLHTVSCHLSANEQEGALQLAIRPRQDPSRTLDPRFMIRDQHASEIKITQHGLFIAFEGGPFDPESMQSDFYKALVEDGYDLWVDIPDNLRLTKGRNSIIAEDRTPFRDALRAAFEDLLADVVLFLRDGASPIGLTTAVQDVVIGIIERRYAKRYKQGLRNQYGRRLRTLAHLLPVLVTVLATTYALLTHVGTLPLGLMRILGQLVESFYRGIGQVPDALGALPHVSQTVAEDVLSTLACAGRRVFAPDDGFVAHARRVLPVTAAFSGTIVYLSHQPTLLLSFRQLLLASFLLYIALSFGLFVSRGIIAGLTRFSLRGILNTAYRVLRALGTRIAKLRPFGIYTNMEARRNRKRSKQLNRLIRRYLAESSEDAFVRRLCVKQFIPATRIERSFSIVQSDDSIRAQPLRVETVETAVRLSIDELVVLSAGGQLFNRRDLVGTYYYVDREHPLVRVIVARLEDIQKDIAQTYDPRLIEDHIDNATALFGQCLSLVGRGVSAPSHHLADRYRRWKSLRAASAHPRDDTSAIATLRSTLRSVVEICQFVGELALPTAKLVGRIGSRSLRFLGRRLRPSVYPRYLRACGGFVFSLLCWLPRPLICLFQSACSLLKVEAYKSWVLERWSRLQHRSATVNGEQLFRLDAEHLQEIVQVLAGGHGYLRVLRFAQELANLLSAAADLPNCPVVLTSIEPRELPGNSALYLTSSGEIALNVRSRLCNKLIFAAETGEMEPYPLAAAFELLLHTTTHRALGYNTHLPSDKPVARTPFRFKSYVARHVRRDRLSGRSVSYEAEFWERKEALRQSIAARCPCPDRELRSYLLPEDLHADARFVARAHITNYTLSALAFYTLAELREPRRRLALRGQYAQTVDRTPHPRVPSEEREKLGASGPLADPVGP